MFTLADIQDAHSKVKSGADFPEYIQALIALGVVKYTIYVSDGHAEYIDKNNYTLNSQAEYPLLEISTEPNIDNFKHYLKTHQQGKTDYLTFCTDSAEAGVVKWIVDLTAKTCTYFDQPDNQILIENIPV